MLVRNTLSVASLGKSPWSIRIQTLPEGKFPLAGEFCGHAHEWLVRFPPNPGLVYPLKRVDRLPAVVRLRPDVASGRRLGAEGNESVELLAERQSFGYDFARWPTVSMTPSWEQLDALASGRHVGPFGSDAAGIDPYTAGGLAIARWSVSGLRVGPHEMEAASSAKTASCLLWKSAATAAT